MLPPQLGGQMNDWPPQLFFFFFFLVYFLSFFLSFFLWALHYHAVSNDRMTLPKQAEKGGNVGGIFTLAAISYHVPLRYDCKSTHAQPCTPQIR